MSPVAAWRPPNGAAQLGGDTTASTPTSVGRLKDTRDPIWQLTAIDVYSSYGWAKLVTCRTGAPHHTQINRLARRVANELRRAGWRLERALTDDGNEYGPAFAKAIHEFGATEARIRAGRSQTNGHVENLRKTILDECWRPAFARYHTLKYTGLRRHLEHYLHAYNTDRAHTGRIIQGRIPADIMEPAECSPNELHLSPQPGESPA